MSKLVDIKGYWDMSLEYDFNEDDMWQGKLLLEDDGWFEGIVNDSTSPYTGDRMIFGIYHPARIIELFKVSPYNVSNPFIFRGQREAEGYDGVFSVLSFFVEQSCGISHLVTQHVEFLKEHNYPEVADRDIDREKIELAKKIARFKQNNDYRELYENAVGKRASLVQNALDKYDGDNLTREEIEELLKPVQGRVKEDTRHGVRKLVRRMFTDDDLPF